MVRGLDRFVAHFKGMEDNYVLIGGCACDLWLNGQGLSFRATKDIDMVIIVEALHHDFVRAFWDFIHKGDYQSLKQSSGKPKFYRFKKPQRKWRCDSQRGGCQKTQKRCLPPSTNDRPSATL